jgi:hypothetical protein
MPSLPEQCFDDSKFLLCTCYQQDDYVKEDEMGGECRTLGGEAKDVGALGWKT